MMIPNNISSENLERGVMSCMIRDTSWPRAYTDACQFIQPKHFEDPTKAKCFAVMANMDVAPDEMTLAEKAGVDFGAILDWSQATETSAQVSYYSEGVLKAWTRRQAEGVSHQLRDGIEMGEDPKEVLAAASKSISDALTDQGTSYTSVSDGLDDVIQHCFDMDEGKVEFLKTGFPDLDKVLGGFKPGEMSVLAARPSNGKTALALSMAALMARAGKKVLFSSLEMSKGQLLKRLVHGEARIPIINNPNHYRSGDRQALRDAAESIKSWPLKIDQASGITVPYLSAKALSEKHRWGGLDALIVDYLGIMEGVGKDTYERVSSISRGLQLLAKRLDCPVIVLSQQNRESENDKTPQMRHLRDSGSVEQDADQIIMLKRLEDGAFKPVETMEAWIVKNRNGGTGKVALTFSRSYARYDSHASDDKPKSYLK